MSVTKNTIFWAFISLLFFAFIWSLQEVLAPFLVGILVAYLMNPLISKFSPKGRRRWLFSSLILLFLALMTVLIFVFVIPFIAVQIYDYMSGVGDYLKDVNKEIAELIDKLLIFLSDEKKQELLHSLTSQYGTILRWVVSVFQSFLSGAVSLVDTISFLIITPIVSFYLMRDWPILQRTITNLIPKQNVKTIKTVLGDIDDTIASFIRGQLFVAIILGTYYALSLGIIGLNFGIIIGILSGVLSIIPYVGTIAGIVAALSVSVFQYDKWEDILIVAVIFIIGNLVEGNYLTPKFVGEKVNLHPVWVLFALLAGGHLMGFTGVLIAIPVAAIIGVLVRFFILKYHKSDLYKLS